MLSGYLNDDFWASESDRIAYDWGRRSQIMQYNKKGVCWFQPPNKIKSTRIPLHDAKNDVPVVLQLHKNPLT